MYQFLFLDLDDTILDFKKAEYIALGKTLESLGLPASDQVRSRYSQINKMHWEMLERGELTREQVLVGRFQMLFREYDIQVDAQQCAWLYAHNLSFGHHFLPGAEEALERLSKKYKLYIVSNGTGSVQKGRLESANISHFFQDIFISQDMGFNKPDKGFFDNCFARIPELDLSRSLIVGDSLTSDILGGINAGIATCWVNPGHEEVRMGIHPDYEIESISQLEGLLERL